MTIATMKPASVQPALAGEPVPAVRESVRRPLFWLTAIVALGFVLRYAQIHASFQLDEFGPLYAIAERQTTTLEMLPAASDPLVPVASLEEVRARSVLPYG